MPAASKSSTEAGARPTNRWPYPRKRRSAAAVEDVTAGGPGNPREPNCCGLAKLWNFVDEWINDHVWRYLRIIWKEKTNGSVNFPLQSLSSRAWIKHQMGMGILIRLYISSRCVLMTLLFFVQRSPHEQTSNQKLKPANQKLKSANQKPKAHESETKNRANQKLKYRNQIQNPANQTLRIRN